MVKIGSKLKLKTKTVQEKIKMKRKLFSLLIVMVMGISLLTGCGGNSNENKDNDTLQSIDNVQEDTTVENTEIEEKEEIDTSIYSEKVELTTGEGKVVSIYYDPTIVTNLSGEDWTGKEEINLGEMMSIYMSDAESVKAYVDTIVDAEGGYIAIDKQEEIQLSGYTIYYFTLNESESGAFLDKMWLIELDSDVVCRFVAISEVTEGSQLEKELEAIKFVVDNGNNTESNQNDNKEDGVEGNLQTYEFPAAVYLDGNETGILTYNADAIEFVSEESYGTKFKMTMKDEKGTYTTSVTFKCCSNENAENYYQDVKSKTLETDANAEISELKETMVNEISVKYFTRIYTMNGNDNRDFYGIVEFPGAGQEEKAIVISMAYKKDEELLLSGLENLLVNIEIEGVKPGVATEAPTAGNDEIDMNIYCAEEQAVTSDGRIVKVYYNPDVIAYWDRPDDVSLYAHDMNDDMYAFSVSDYVSAEDYRAEVLQFYGKDIEATELEEQQLGGHTIHSFQIVDGSRTIRYGVIELGSGVILDIDYKHSNGDEAALEEVLGAIRFVVE